MCQAGPRWHPNCEITWHTEWLLLHVRYTNSKRSPSSNAIKRRVLLFCHKTKLPPPYLTNQSACAKRYDKMSY